MSELLLSGLELMLVGMAIVVLFLSMLILAVKAMSTLIACYIHPPIPITTDAISENPTFQGNSDPAVIAAIIAAVHQYRSQRLPKS